MTFNVVNDMLNWILPDKLFVRIFLLLSQYILFEIINMFNQLTVESEKVSNDLSINDGLQRMFSYGRLVKGNNTWYWDGNDIIQTCDGLFFFSY